MHPSAPPHLCHLLQFTPSHTPPSQPFNAPLHPLQCTPLHPKHYPFSAPQHPCSFFSAPLHAHPILQYTPLHLPIAPSMRSSTPPLSVDPPRATPFSAPSAPHHTTPSVHPPRATPFSAPSAPHHTAPSVHPPRATPFSAPSAPMPHLLPELLPADVALVQRHRAAVVLVDVAVQRVFTLHHLQQQHFTLRTIPPTIRAVNQDQTRHSSGESAARREHRQFSTSSQR